MENNQVDIHLAGHLFICSLCCSCGGINSNTTGFQYCHTHLPAAITHSDDTAQTDDHAGSLS